MALIDAFGIHGLRCSHYLNPCNVLTIVAYFILSVLVYSPFVTRNVLSPQLIG